MRPPLNGNIIRDESGKLIYLGTFKVTSWPWSVQANGTPHGGYDFACPIGTPEFAVERFYADFVGWDSGKGIAGEGGLGRWRYWHLDSFAIGIGWVEEGQLIGYSGNTGVSTAPHLHCDCKKNGIYIDYMEAIMSCETDLANVKKWLKDCGDMARKAAKDTGYNIDSLPDSQAVQWVCDRCREWHNQPGGTFIPYGGTQLYVKA